MTTTTLDGRATRALADEMSTRTAAPVAEFLTITGPDMPRVWAAVNEGLLLASCGGDADLARDVTRVLCVLEEGDYAGQGDDPMDDAGTITCREFTDATMTDPYSHLLAAAQLVLQENPR